VSASQPETFSPRNLTVLGGLLLLAIFIGEVLIGPNHGDEVVAEVMDTMEDVAMRIRPVVTLDDIRSGKSTSGGGDSQMAASAAPDTSSMTPDQLYQGACLACHTTGAAGAPKIGDAAVWGERKSKGLDGLVASAIGGIGAMPPRGGSTYDDDQIRAVVEYILANSE
jgi:cytochrome c5